MKRIVLPLIVLLAAALGAHAALAQDVIPAQPIGVATPKVGARLRSGPSTAHETLLVMDQGETFTVLGETENHWYYVDYDGQIGYVSAEVASIVEQADMLPTAFYAILTGEKAFERRGGRETIGELDACFGVEAELAPTGFAVLNLDGDALREVVVRVSMGESDFGFLVLDLQTELVYGYTFFLRAILDIKQDGTFTYSSGAMDNGVGRLTFRGPVAEIAELAGCRDGEDGELVCSVNGEPVSWTEYEAFIRTQDAKPGVDWLPFTRAQEIFFANPG